MKGHEKRVSGVNNPSVRLVPRLTPSRAVETALGREISPQWEISKFASGKEPTSSRQGVWVCDALRLPHDLIRLPLLFPQNSSCDFCGSPEIIPQTLKAKKALAHPRRGGYDRVTSSRNERTAKAEKTHGGRRAFRVCVAFVLRFAFCVAFVLRFAFYVCVAFVLRLRLRFAFCVCVAFVFAFALRLRLRLRFAFCVCVCVLLAFCVCVAFAVYFGSACGPVMGCPRHDHSSSGGTGAVPLTSGVSGAEASGASSRTLPR